MGEAQARETQTKRTDANPLDDRAQALPERKMEKAATVADASAAVTANWCNRQIVGSGFGCRSWWKRAGIGGGARLVDISLIILSVPWRSQLAICMQETQK